MRHPVDSMRRNSESMDDKLEQINNMIMGNLMGPSNVEEYVSFFEPPYHPRSPPWGVLLSLGSRKVRGWYADGTGMVRGFEKRHVFFDI